MHHVVGDVGDLDDRVRAPSARTFGKARIDAPLVRRDDRPGRRWQAVPEPPRSRRALREKHCASPFAFPSSFPVGRDSFLAPSPYTHPATARARQRGCRSGALHTQNSNALSREYGAQMPVRAGVSAHARLAFCPTQITALCGAPCSALANAFNLKNDAALRALLAQAGQMQNRRSRRGRQVAWTDCGSGQDDLLAARCARARWRCEYRPPGGCARTMRS